MGKCRGGLRPLAGVANADGPGCACLLSCPRSDTLCVSRRRSELPLRQRVFVGRAGNKCVKQIDDVHVGGIWRGKEVVVGLMLGLLEILTSKAVRLEKDMEIETSSPNQCNCDCDIALPIAELQGGLSCLCRLVVEGHDFMRIISERKSRQRTTLMRIVCRCRS
jgi:hypothetical protein